MGKKQRRGCRQLLLLALLAALISAATSEPTSVFTQHDNYLIACGSNSPVTHLDNRVFAAGRTSGKYFSSDGHEILVSVPSADVPSPLYLSARVFTEKATYSFPITRKGWHWVRLHFFPVTSPEFDLLRSKFTVTTDSLVLLHEFSANNATWFFKEYLINVANNHLSVKFNPSKGSHAFINAVEVVSAPDILIGDVGYNLFPPSQFTGLSSHSYETVYRINVGGPAITSQGDTLGRSWSADSGYLEHKELGQNISVPPSEIKYPQGGSPWIAPQSVYSTAVAMADAMDKESNLNVSWSFEIDMAYQHLIRLHFCDIFSKSVDDLFFNVYINGKTAISGLGISTLVGGLATAYFKDFVIDSSAVTSPLRIQIGPFPESLGTKNAIINGVEILKMNNSVNSMDGLFGIDGSSAGAGNVNKTTVAAVGFAMMAGALVGVAAMAVRWHRRPLDWQKSKSFSSWLLPVQAGDSTFMSSKGSASLSQRSQFSSVMGLGRFFTFAELTEATRNWEPKAVIGVGGFGNVYLGVIDDSMKVAVKRGNPKSEQGIHEFQTEIQMLSKLRHRHLVSLVGYCDENSEMILVYEYMCNGPFRDHLYGKNLPTLTWKQRLEICIGAARGLHYLHTGTASGIIHRDVKTTNILLDDNFVAKVADFGLSKDAPGTEQAHVSTAVKGSFGYLDPEYFRKQHLTDKSDVYSFGVVLFEVLCARPAISAGLPRDQVSLAEWAMQWQRKGLIGKIMDPSIVGTAARDSMKSFAEAAESCLAQYGEDRPSMGDVLWKLEYALQLQLQQEASRKSNSSDGGSSPEHGGMTEEVVLAFDGGEDHGPVASTEEDEDGPPEIPVAVDERSGTVMFAQFSSINGR